jgi:hypothetical protein
MIKHISAHLLLLFAVIAACTSCAVTDSGNRSDNPLVGHWAGMSGTREVLIALHPDGRCDGLEPGVTLLGTWTQKGPNIVITFDGEVLHGGLLSRREMLLTKESSGQTITLTKTGRKTLTPRKPQ